MKKYAAVLTIAIGFVIFVLGATAVLPIHAVSYLDVTPDKIPTGDSVTITINFVSLGPDIVKNLKVIDPVGNVFEYTGSLPTLDSANPTWSTTFPSASWQRISGPGGNTGTDIPGNYKAEAIYDTYLGTEEVYDNFSCDDRFSVPEFLGLPIVASVATSMYLLIRKRLDKRED